jgi:REP element-mobilizing transposase RayT
MAHSINRQYIHFVWSTKDLHPLISDNSQSFMLAYLTGIMKKLGGYVLASSSTSNHIHLLANTPTDISVAKLLSQIKASSSKWYREANSNSSSFAWNEGYSAFTVSHESIDSVKRYLAKEKYRHENSSFEDELLRFLKIQELEFNPKFLTKSTHTKLIYHLVWSVKNREALLNASLQMPLHLCIRKEIEVNGNKLYAIGNVSDHIHILVECSSSTTIANFVQNLKTTSTHLIKSQDKKLAHFCWQEGYGAFSVSKPGLNAVLSYVNDQENHHRIKTFDEEWNFLKA